MSALRELQCAVGRAVLGRDEASIVEAIHGDGLDPAARLGIYRNHYLFSLTEALKAIYPVVCRLVDERFFDYAARGFIDKAPPREPCLFEYGAAFPNFLAEFPAAAKVIYLPDVARLEWAINAALHAPAEAPIDGSAFAGVAGADYSKLVFRLQPSVGFLASDWPVDRIWQANRPENENVGPLDLDEGGCCLEIRQQDDAVVFRRLEAGDFALRKALAEGQSLEAAAAVVLERDPLFDLPMALRRLMGEGLIVGFRLSSPTPMPEEASPCS
ncbi:MAG TPA: DNA-binding domain-containing protein [Candidatus Udaeobacter sp.]|nr:DNA-binding domain-containing protein [Candidatus Udaeobacter sp.]